MPLGIGAHFSRWGYSESKIQELDWYDTASVSNTLNIHLIPARHYSGRGLTKNKTLWGGYVLEWQGRRILLGGDSGYGKHFKKIHQRYGDFDLVALDTGQYDPRWPSIHMTPKESAQAAEDLNTEILLPIHIGRFALARHPWYEPFEGIEDAVNGKPYKLISPLIGEEVKLNELQRGFIPWWTK